MADLRRCAICAAALSRYNTARHCHSCRTQTHPTVKVQATAAMLADASVRFALADADWGRVLQAVIEATGVTQTAIAASTGVSQSFISRLITGRCHEPGLSTIRALCDGLEIPRPMAGLAETNATEAATDRRQLLAASAGTAGLALLGAAAGAGADEALIGQATMVLRRLEQHTPTRALLGSATAHADLARTLRRRAGTGAAARRLAAAESEAAGLAAWLYADLDEQANARRCYRLAIGAAVRAGNPLLACYMRGSFGQFATSTGTAIAGRDLITQARAELPRSAPSIALLWLEALHATALAHLGQRTALSVLDTAAQRLRKASATEPVWPWLFAFDEAKLANHRAVVATRLGQHRQAEQWFAASTTSGSPKQRAVTDVARATALAAAGDVARACHLACGALDVGRVLGSERVIRAVTTFRTGLPATTATADLDRRLSVSYEEDL